MKDHIIDDNCKWHEIRSIPDDLPEDGKPIITVWETPTHEIVHHLLTEPDDVDAEYICNGMSGFDGVSKCIAWVYLDLYEPNSERR